MRTPFQITKLLTIPLDTSLPLSECREFVEFDLDQDDPHDRAKLAQFAAWLALEAAPGTWRQWTNPLRNRSSFGFADPVLAVQFKLTFG